MNDFVPKPIELKNICSKIRTWLPKELIQKEKKNIETQSDKEQKEITEDIENSFREQIKTLGGELLFSINFFACSIASEPVLVKSSDLLISELISAEVCVILPI